jgi:hypothetical protein
MMVRYHNIDGQKVAFTAEEETARDSDEAIEAAKKDDYEANEKYKDIRKAEYPPIGDQLDALWKGGQAAADMKAIIDGVKAKHPKP